MTKNELKEAITGLVETQGLDIEINDDMKKPELEEIYKSITEPEESKEVQKAVKAPKQATLAQCLSQLYGRKNK